MHSQWPQSALDAVKGAQDMWASTHKEPPQQIFFTQREFYGNLVVPAMKAIIQGFHIQPTHGMIMKGLNPRKYSLSLPLRELRYVYNVVTPQKGVVSRIFTSLEAQRNDTERCPLLAVNPTLIGYTTLTYQTFVEDFLTMFADISELLVDFNWSPLDMASCTTDRLHNVDHQ